MDLRGGPRPPVPVQGQLLHLFGDQGQAYGDPGSQGRQARQASEERARLGAFLAKGPPGQEQGPSGALRPDGAGGAQQQEARLLRNPDSGRSAPGLHRAGGRAYPQGVRRPRAHRRPELHPAAQRHRRRDRPERRGQVHAVQDHRRSGAADLRFAEDRRHREDQLRGPEPRRPRSEQEPVGSRLRRSRLH